MPSKLAGPLAIAVALAGAACSGPTSPASPPPTTAAAGGRDLATLRSQRERFRAVVGENYDIEQAATYAFFRPDPVRLSVRDGRIVGMRRAADSTLAPADWRGLFFTVEGLFDEIERNLANGWPTTVEYDPRHGHPSRASFSGSPGRDREFSVTVKLLRRVPRDLPRILARPDE